MFGWSKRTQVTKSTVRIAAELNRLCDAHDEILRRLQPRRGHRTPYIVLSAALFIMACLAMMLAQRIPMLTTVAAALLAMSVPIWFFPDLIALLLWHLGMVDDPLRRGGREVLIQQIAEKRDELLVAAENDQQKP